MKTLAINKSSKAISLKFEDGKMIISLEDGQEFSVPLEWFSIAEGFSTTIGKLAFYWRWRRNSFGKN